MSEPIFSNVVNGSEPSYQLGVTEISDMTDRQIAEETLFWLRETGKALQAIQKEGLGGVFKAMMSGKR